MFALFFCLFNNLSIQTFDSSIQTFNLPVAVCTITKNSLSPVDQNNGVGLEKEMQIFQLPPVHPFFAYYALGKRTSYIF